MTVDLEYETDRGDNLYHARLVHAAADALMFADEAVAFTPDGQGGLPEPVSLGSGHKESAVPEAGKAGNRTAAAAFGCMSKWRFYQFHDTSATSGMRATHYIHDNRYLRSDAGNLAAYLHLLREMEPRHYAVIVDTIRLAAPFFDDFELGPLELNTERVVLGWRERESGHRFGPHQLSDGTLRFIALCTLLLQPGERRPEIMVIDEPELGLHPHAISLLGSMVRSASHDRQILLATQSVDLVNEFEPESIVVVDHHAGESSFTRLRTEDLADWLEDYSIGELWEKNVLGGRPSH